MMKNPLLELVKSLCHVMLLSKKTTIEVRELRKELLTIFDIKEFAKISEFKDPSSSLDITGFLCEYCSHFSDLDFCKSDPATIFNCEKCHKEFNKLLLQEHLVQKLYGEIESYLTQDLCCSKCNKIKQDYMSTHCQCSGSWKGSISQDSVTKMIEVYKQVAGYYEFEVLTNALEELF